MNGTRTAHDALSAYVERRRSARPAPDSPGVHRRLPGGLRRSAGQPKTRNNLCRVKHHVKLIAITLAVCLAGLGIYEVSRTKNPNSAEAAAKALKAAGLFTITTDKLPPRALVASWPAKWCQAAPGVTSKDALIALMGKPTDEAGDSLSWDGYEYQFNAFIGVDGGIHQMDINDIQLSPSERAALPCDTTRVAP